MARIVCENTYDLSRIPSQQAFRKSKATIRGYGGAMGRPGRGKVTGAL